MRLVLVVYMLLMMGFGVVCLHIPTGKLLLTASLDGQECHLPPIQLN
jgi:hypothetical protein